MIKRLLHQEEGIAMAMALGIMAIFSIVAVSVMTLADNNRSRDRRDTKISLAYQAAEAGMNAYLSDLTESNVFYNSYLAKGEATRTDSNNVTHASSNTSDVAWSSGTTWTYKTSPSSDTGWYDLGNGYQYLTYVYPPSSSVSGYAGQISRIDVIGRPKGSTDQTTWKTMETMLRPSALTDFQAFTATSVTYANTATTNGPIFVGHDKNGTLGTLKHDGTAKANLYAEGTVTTDSGYTTNFTNGARKYDKSTTPTALCKLNNCASIDFSQFASTITTVQGAASAGGITLTSTDTTNSGLSGQGYSVDAWKLDFQSNGTVKIASCKQSSYTYNRNTYYNEVWENSTPPVCGTQTTKTVPSNGAIYSPVDVIVDGVVKGRVTVATAGDGVFGGNLTYNTPGTDVLGVETQGTMWVASWGRADPGTETVNAAILALNGPFAAESSPPTCGTRTADCDFIINGSIAVYGASAGAIQLSQAFDHRTYNYDNNLLFAQPPYWPTLGNSFDILVQREVG
jgi:Tfp pilus assembly protein PilX